MTCWWKNCDTNIINTGKEKRIITENRVVVTIVDWLLLWQNECAFTLLFLTKVTARYTNHASLLWWVDFSSVALRGDPGVEIAKEKQHFFPGSSKANSSRDCCCCSESYCTTLHWFTLVDYVLHAARVHMQKLPLGEDPWVNSNGTWFLTLVELNEFDWGSLFFFLIFEWVVKTQHSTSLLKVVWYAYGNDSVHSMTCIFVQIELLSKVYVAIGGVSSAKTSQRFMKSAVWLHLFCVTKVLIFPQCMIFD